MKNLIKSSLIIFLLGCFFLTCNKEEEITTGTIKLNLPTKQLKTLEPAISMVPVSYGINGTGPNGAAFTLNSDLEIVEIPGLTYGEWTVTVNAINVDGTVIGSGQATCTVYVGETTQVDILVSPLEGIGVLDLTVNWNTGDTEYPTIESQLIPPTGTPLDLGFSIINGNQGTYVNNAVPTGFHTLIVKLLDGNPANTTPVLTMGAVEVVRIVYNETTSGTFDFTQINKPGGNIQINIEQQLNDPIEVTLSGQQVSILENESMTITASVPVDVGNVSFVWYINGESQATGESYTVTGFPVGVYRLDVTAFSVDGERAGSASIVFRVEEDFSSDLGFGEVIYETQTLTLETLSANYYSIHQIDHVLNSPFSLESLSESGQLVYNDDNSGGSSIISESLAMEALLNYVNASLLYTESGITYLDDAGLKYDFLVEIYNEPIGVSVTRAIGYPYEEPLTINACVDLLNGKLNDIILAQANINQTTNPSTKGILFIYSANEVTKQNLISGLGLIESQILSNTVIILATSSGTYADIIYSTEGQIDNDLDGYTISQGDCDDNDPNKYPGQTWYTDCDGDGYFSSNGIISCDEPVFSQCNSLLPPLGGYSIIPGNDCDDEDANIYPAADEVCGDGIDQNCDGVDLECSPYVSINELRTNSYQIGQLVSLSNVIVSSIEDNGMFSIQDQSGNIPGGMFVWPSTPISGLNVGDMINITGILTDYNSLLELTDISDLVIVSSGNYIQPITFLPEEITTILCSFCLSAENYEGMKVELQNLEVAGTSTIYSNLVVETSSEVILMIPSNLGVDISIGEVITLTRGIVKEDNGEYHIKINSTEDILK